MDGVWLSKNCIQKMACRFLKWLLLAGILSMAVAEAQTQEAVKTYIVYMASWQKPASYASHDHWYASLAESMSTKVIYSYKEVFHGFAARLSADQVESLRTAPGVLGIHSNKVYQLHTTRTPEFLGLNPNAGLWPVSEYGNDVIVGVVDTGVWPESESFSDAGFGPPPAKWKGQCNGGEGFQCNRKLIGARFYNNVLEALQAASGSNDTMSARDFAGHGTHTASTAAGVPVQYANMLGYANGTAHGMATRARIAVYKVCGSSGCQASDILAGMENAVADGVDVLSISIGSISAIDYKEDPIASGALGAIKKGIFVSCSAGNDGPDLFTVSNVAPWVTTVGASTVDRDFWASAVLGNGMQYRGSSLYAGKPLPEGLLPLIYAGNSSLRSAQYASLCVSGTLDPNLVAGKIVVCDAGENEPAEKGIVVKEAGGAGMILADSAENNEETLADAHLLPAVAVGEKEGHAIKQYLFSAASPVATMQFHGTVLRVKPAPVMAAFSSRGPSALTPDILKPDMTAPGVNILAAWTGETGPTELAVDTRRVPFNIISGTSMSCPHVSGMAALLKGAHPDWSPAAIKSALMTTATTVDNAGGPILDLATGKPSTPLVHGAGHVDPKAALSPGLVYDLGLLDYLKFLCSVNYTDNDIRPFAGVNFTCGDAVNSSPADLNYPSFVVNFINSVVRVTRTVTNVGTAGSSYNVSFSTPLEVGMKIEPTTLQFAEVGDKKTYTVVFSSNKVPSRKGTSFAFGSLTWMDGKHNVRSPVVFMWP